MSFTRAAGVGGIVFAVTVAGANVFLAGLGKPLGDAQLTQIVDYYIEHGGAASLMSYIAPVGWVAIALFAVGILVSTRRPDGQTSGWAHLGLVGVAMMVPTFCGVVTADAVLAARASTLASNPQYTLMLWDFHMVLQILNWTFVAIALAGFGMATIVSGTAPRLGKAAIAGAVLLLVGATQSLPGLRGSTSVLIGLPGFLVWIVFVIGYSVRMIRSGAPVRRA